jgi:precorrin-8X/cobalt-precorrin-8 methylmutase
MALAGIDKGRLSALGGKALCFSQDPFAAAKALQDKTTRAKAAVDIAMAASIPPPLIFAVGNAPTALARICELHSLGLLNPDFVIGAPVGFVNVLESKEMLVASGLPYAMVSGRKGGSPVAAAMVNALLRMAEALA